LPEGENPHPANDRGCRHAEEMQKIKSQRTPMTTRETVFASNLKIPLMSSDSNLRGKREEQQQSRIYQVAGRDTMESRVSSALSHHKQKKTGQSIWAPIVNYLSLDKMLNVVITVVQQNMTNILAITKIVLHLMGQNWPLEFISTSEL
jgi:hypothetical protein